jgi:Gas vesicle synthesis protein GvpL/GvpF.
MAGEGKYIYCVIGSDEARNFGPIGVGGRGNIVSTVGYQGISAVISNFPMTKYEISKENLIAHEKVIEKVMQDYAVLPVRAFTVAASAEEVRSFLRKNYAGLKGILKDMDNKIELGVKAYWKDMKTIFQEIVDETERIKKLRDKIALKPQGQSTEKIRLGEMAASALKAKKDREGEELLRGLKRVAYDFRLNETRGDEMIINAAFLVDRGREKEFDNRVDELDRKYGQRIKFTYVGPAPPYNFVRLTIK